MMFCTPCGVASWPDSAIGLSFFAFSIATTAPAMLSFAAMAPSILFPVFSSICVKIGPAFVASQSGTNCCGPFVILPLLNSGFRILSFPLLNQYAFWSVGPPQSSATTGFDLPFSAFRMPLACAGSDCNPVEGDVDLRDAADHLAVVVDRRPARLRELLLDRDGRTRGDVHDDRHLRALREARVGLSGHLLRLVQARC